MSASVGKKRVVNICCGQSRCTLSVFCTILSPPNRSLVLGGTKYWSAHFEGESILVIAVYCDSFTHLPTHTLLLLFSAFQKRPHTPV